jgi:glycosyltransferase involved in cell wall biosynthesis
VIKILFDTDIFIRQRFGGIRTYYTSLITELLKLPVSIHPKFSELQQISPAGNIADAAAHAARLSRSIVRIFPFVHSNVDLYHPTYYTDPFISLHKFPTIVTIHDMIHEKYSDFFDRGYSRSRLKAYISAKLKCMIHATAIISVSQSTADDILDTYPFIESSKIYVVPHGSHHLGRPTSKLFDTSPFLFNLTNQPYILYVGSRSNYKGFFILLRALASIPSFSNLIKLVCIGSHFTINEHTAIQSLGLTNTVISYSANDCEMAHLYSSALCFVYPSFCEGFGLPILEAMSLNCPIICSDIPPFREVGGSLPFYYNPYDFTHLSSLLSYIIANSSSIKVAQQYSSMLQASLFTWRNTARLTYDVYQSSVMG